MTGHTIPEGVLPALADTVGQLLWSATRTGSSADSYETEYVNRRWIEYTGLTLEETKAGGWESAVHPDDIASLHRCWVDAVNTGNNYQAEARFRRKEDGTYRWHLINGSPVEDETATIATEEKGAGGENSPRWIGAATDIHEHKVTVENMRFLSEAGAILASSLDYQTTLKSVARLAVPRIADWSAVDIVTKSGKVERLAVEHLDPKTIEFVEMLQSRYPEDPNAEGGLPEVLRTGNSSLFSDIPDELLVQSAKDPEHLRLIRLLG
jgi:PAS domain S-box-containing protein